MAKGNSGPVAKLRDKAKVLGIVNSKGGYKRFSENATGEIGTARRDGAYKYLAPRRQICATGMKRIDVMVACFDGAVVQGKAKIRRQGRRYGQGNNRSSLVVTGFSADMYAPAGEAWEIVTPR